MHSETVKITDIQKFELKTVSDVRDEEENLAKISKTFPAFGSLDYIWDINSDWKNIRKDIKIIIVIMGIYESNQRKPCCDAEFQKIFRSNKADCILLRNPS